MPARPVPAVTPGARPPWPTVPGTWRAGRFGVAVALAAVLAACSAVAPDTTSDRAAREALMTKVWRTVGERHVDAPPPDWSRAIDRHRAQVLGAPPLDQDPDALWTALDGLAAEWRDAHTRVEGPSDHARLVRREVVTPGFGLVPVSQQWVATAVVTGSEAWAAGLRDGMTLVSWNAESPKAVWARLQASRRPSSTPQASDTVALRRWLHGPPGSVVDTVWARPDGSTLRVTVPRRVRSIAPRWSSRTLPSGVVVLRWTAFDPILEAGLTDALRRLGPEVPGLILDLRGNGGGSYDMTRRLAEALLDGQVHGPVVGRRGEVGEPVVLRGRSLYRGRLVVLQDATSASGSELLARTLQAVGRAQVVGSVSCGCLLSIVRHVPLGPQARLAVSERHIRWPDGRVEGVGVRPDVPVTVTLEALQAGRDEPLEAAERAVLRPSAR